MTDEQLQKDWPELALLVRELRLLTHTALADRLVDAVQYASTSGEICADVGNALYEPRAMRKQLSTAGRDAWKRVMADVGRAFGRPTFFEWLANLFGPKS